MHTLYVHQMIANLNKRTFLFNEENISFDIKVHCIKQMKAIQIRFEFRLSILKF